MIAPTLKHILSGGTVRNEKPTRWRQLAINNRRLACEMRTSKFRILTHADSFERQVPSQRCCALGRGDGRTRLSPYSRDEGATLYTS